MAKRSFYLIAYDISDPRRQAQARPRLGQPHRTWPDGPAVGRAGGWMDDPVEQDPAP